MLIRGRKKILSLWFNTDPASPGEGGDPPPTDPVDPPAGGGGGGGAPNTPLNPPSSEGGDPPADPPAPSSGEGPADPPPSDPSAEDPPVEAWSKALPEDWREKMAEGDEAKLNVLKRFTSPDDVIKSFFEGRDKISKGLIETGLPENPTDEQLKEYREAHGIPESPDKYELKLDEGLVLGEKDRELYAPVYEAMHEYNIPAEAASKITNAFLQQQEELARKTEEQDTLDSQNVMGMLREQWKGETQANINLIKGMFTQAFPQETADQIMGARLPNGKALFNDPSALTAFASMARKINPAATLVPNTADPMKTLNQEKSDLEKDMAADIDAWHKNPEKKARYRQVLEALEQQQAIDG